MQRPVHQVPSNHWICSDERFCCLVAFGVEDQDTSSTGLVLIIHKKTTSHGKPSATLSLNPTAMVIAMHATLLS